MLYKYMLIAIVFILIYVQTNRATDDNDNDDDGNDNYPDIHRSCFHRSKFTNKEIDTAMKYLQNRFTNNAIIPPKKPPCKRLRVTRDFKCLTDYERREWIETFLELYRNGFINERISYFHGTYWPFTHIMAEAIPWHYAFQHDTQQQITQINPNVVNPYWDTTLDFGAPEKSIVWDYLGRAGNSNNDYCLPNGPFRNLTVKYPTPHCVRRQWDNDRTIASWESPEVLTYILQQSIGDLSVYAPMYYSQHFKKHLNIGGYNGDITSAYATNDPAFWLYHIFDGYVHVMRWQLQNDTSLTPVGLGFLGRHIPAYECNGSLVLSDVSTDLMLNYNVTIIEPIQYGFGNACYISDVMVEAIGNVVNNRRPRYPAAVDRLRRALPPQKFAEFFPKFADNTANEFNYILPDVGNRGNRRCKPLPLPPRYSSNANYIRQFEGFKQCDQDIQAFVLSGEQKIEAFINTLNSYGYCSPYL